MRKTFRITYKGFTLFMLVSHTQTLRGITSKVDEDTHFIFWDLDNCTIDECINELLRIQKKHELSTIYIMSDKENSFRAICFTQRTLKGLIHILSDTKYVEREYLYYTLRYSKATLRFEPKSDRKTPIMEIVDILHSNIKPEPIPNNITTVLYDTGLQKISDKVDIRLEGGDKNR